LPGGACFAYLKLEKNSFVYFSEAEISHEKVKKHIIFIKFEKLIFYKKIRIFPLFIGLQIAF